MNGKELAVSGIMERPQNTKAAGFDYRRLILGSLPLVAIPIRRARMALKFEMQITGVRR